MNSLDTTSCNGWLGGYLGVRYGVSPTIIQANGGS